MLWILCVFATFFDFGIYAQLYFFTIETFIIIIPSHFKHKNYRNAFIFIYLLFSKCEGERTREILRIRTTSSCYCQRFLRDSFFSIFFLSFSKYNKRFDVKMVPRDVLRGIEMKLMFKWLLIPLKNKKIPLDNNSNIHWTLKITKT